MPIHVQGPDGATVEFPDGTTNDVMQKALQDHYANYQQPSPPSAIQQLGQETLRAGGNVVKGVGGLVDLPIDLLNRGVEHFGGQPNYFKTIHGLVDTGLNKAGVPEQTSGVGNVVGRVEQGLGGLVTGMGAGSVLSGSASPVAQNIGKALMSNPGAQAAATATGATAGGVAHEMGASPTTELLAGLAGGLTPAAGEAAAQGTAQLGARLLGQPSQTTARLAQVAENAGIPLKGSQISESKVGKLLDSGTGQVPFSGAKAFQGEQQTAFNRAVANTIGENADAITPEVFARAKSRIGQMYNDLASRVNPVLTPQTQQNLVGILNDARSLGADDSVKAVTNILRRIQTQQVNGTLPGQAYKSIDSVLGNLIKNGGEKGNYARQIQSELRDAFANSASSPEDQALMQTANQQYRDLKTIEPLVAKAAENGGNISPALLKNAVLATKAGKASVAMGRRGDLGDISQVGSRFLKDTIPDSGTASRTALFDALKGGGAVLGSALGTGAAINPVAGLATAGGVIGIARTVQNILKDPRLMDAMLQTPAGKDRLRALMNQALQTSANPAAQAAISSGNISPR